MTTDCRLAFSGKINYFVTDVNYKQTLLPNLKIYKMKLREGTVDRMQDEHAVIGRTLFSKDTVFDKFLGMGVTLSTGERGTIEGAFGKTGKFKVRIPDGLGPEASALLAKKGKGKKDEAPTPGDDRPPVKIWLEFKRYIYDTDKLMVQ